MSKKILVTGGLGFIGTNLIQKLLKTTDDSFIILDAQMYKGALNNLPRDTSFKKRITFIGGDITKKKNVEKVVEQVQVIIHLAASTHTATSFKKPTDFIKTNVIGTARLLDAAFKYSVDRFIYISSSEVYGNRQKHEKMDEKHPFAPISPYAVTKLAADRLVYSYHLTKKLPVVILRPFNTYGPYQQTEKMIPLFISRLLKNLPITLNMGGKQKRDWVFIDDHLRAIEAVLNATDSKVHGESFNIGTGRSVSTKEVALLILKALNKSRDLLKIDYGSIPGTLGNVGVSKKAEMVLGWRHKVSLEEGIAKTVAWYKNNIRWWDK